MTTDTATAPALTAPLRAAQPAPETLPPGPRRPAFAQTLDWIRNPERFMSECAREFGSTFTAKLGPNTDVVFLSDPQSVKQVFHGSPHELNMGDVNGLFRAVLGRSSLLVTDGDQHLRQRRLLAPPFRGKQIDRYYPTMIQAAEEDVAGWKVGETIPLHPRMQAVTLNVILAAVFGLRPGPRRDQLRTLLARTLRLTNTSATTLPQLRKELGGLTPWGQLMRCLAEVDRELRVEIANRRAQADRPDDVLSLLLNAQDAGSEPMTEGELCEQLLTMLVGGHETTATALSWAFERVVRHPAVVARIREELEVGDTTFLDAAIKESLRLRPTLPIVARKCTVPFTVGDREYRPGTVLMPCIYLLHRNPELFEAPEEFRPERFVGAQPPPYSFIPFGGGARHCLGWSFALAEMRAVMQSVLTRVELRPASRGDEPVARRNFTLAPRRGARVVVARRLAA